MRYTGTVGSPRYLLLRFMNLMSHFQQALLKLGLAGPGVEIRLSAKEPEEGFEEVVDTLVLLGEVQIHRVEASVICGRHDGSRAKLSVSRFLLLLCASWARKGRSREEGEENCVW